MSAADRAEPERLLAALKPQVAATKAQALDLLADIQEVKAKAQAVSSESPMWPMAQLVLIQCEAIRGMVADVNDLDGELSSQLTVSGAD